MSDIDVTGLRKMVDDAITHWASGASPTNPSTANKLTEIVNGERELPKDKRVVRTKSSGDRVYLLDEVKKTRSWITSPEVLQKLGFEVGDVVEIDDETMLKYQMSAPTYRVDSET